jgi:4-aminobutyrate aminotransferase/(S)-3-amino-2-methylpropionate transaminase
VFIADEIQTGFARTGKMFAMEHYGVEPDLMTTAKSLAGGFPLAGVIGKAQIMDAPIAGGLGGTYAASAVSCAAALAVIEVMEQEKLPARAMHVGEVLTQRLRKLQAEFTCVGEVRGLGAMVAMELVRNRDANAPDADLAKALVQRAAANGLVLLSCGIYGNVIRLLVPLTASDAIINEGLDIIEKSLREVLAAATPIAATG